MASDEICRVQGDSIGAVASQPPLVLVSNGNAGAECGVEVGRDTFGKARVLLLTSVLE